MPVFHSHRLSGGSGGTRSYRQAFRASGNAVEAARKRAILNSTITTEPSAEKCPEPVKEK